MNRNKAPDDPNRMINDPGNYKWGIFYYNPGDSRFIVPKRNRLMGWTLNFAHPFSYLVLLSIIAFGIIISKLNAWLG